MWGVEMKFYSSIGFKLNCIIAGLLLATSMTIIGITNYIARENLEEQMLGELLPSKVNDIYGVIEKDLIKRAYALGLAVENPFLRELVESGRDGEHEKIIFKMNKANAAVLGTTGSNFISNISKNYYELQNGKTSVRRLGASDGWFDAFGNTGKDVLINVYVDHPDWGSTAFINRRMDKNGDFLGMISCGVNLDSFVKNIASMVVGTKGVNYMVDKQGVVRLHSNKDQINKVNINSVKGYENDASLILSRDSHVFEFTDENGERWYVMSRYVPELDWVLVAKASKDELFAKMNDALYLTIAVAIGLVLLGILAGYIFIRSITKPLNQCCGYAQSIADGDLEVNSPAKRKDELGVLSGAMTLMVEKLKELINDANHKSELANTKTEEAEVALREAEEAKEQAMRARSEGLNEAADRLEDMVNALSSASEQFSAQVEQVGRGADIQKQRMETTATAMEELNSTVLEVARNAGGSAQSAGEARKMAAGGNEIVSDVIVSVNDVLQRTMTMKVSLAELGDEAENIGSIMSVINDIADQTNLLALNAAIEAARAGEAGRGFAVVADEVRKLAESTVSATQEVGKAITAIQAGTRKNIDEMGMAEQAVERSNDLTGKAGEALSGIVDIVAETTDQVSAIATAAEEQSAASEEITHAIDEVNTISIETADGMTQAREAVAELAALSNQLTGLIANLRKG